MRVNKPKGEETVWTLAKGESRARALTRTIPSIGVELRFLWNDDTRETKVYRNTGELAAAAIQKREQLVGQGWADVPPMWGN
jgi:hypothetical protein